MNPKIVYTILRKELLETLRDKRTLIAMIGIPMVLYPLLLIVVMQVAIVQQSRIEEADSKIALTENVAGPVRGWLEAIDMIEIVAVDDPMAELQAGELDAVVTPQDDTAASLARQGSAQIRIEYDATEMESREARDRIVRGLREQADQLLQDRLAGAGLSEEFAEPLDIQSQDIAPPEKTTGSVLGRILPMLLIIMLGVGAFYPAVDLTAGEKERGTFETLLSTPTSKLEIVCGKFLTVFILSIIAGLLNLGSMVLTLVYLLSQNSNGGEAGGFSLASVQLSAMNITLMFLILIPLAFFICSVMMTIALFARSFKEAQNFVSPFYMFILLPAMFAAMPGVELTRATMFIPITNVALLFKGLLVGKITLELAFGVFLSTAVFALLALVLAVWIFQREEVILSQEKGFPLTLRRSAFIPRHNPTPGMSLMLFALMLLLMFYVGSYVQGRDVISGLFITEWALLLLPTVLILWYVRVDLRQSLSLNRPRLGALAAAVLMAGGMIVLAIQLSVWQNRILPLPEGMAEQMAKLFETDGSLQSTLLLLLAFALSPAICEEVLFRGAILSGLRTKLPPAAAIIIVGILFGLFHLSIYRLLTTAILGIAITYLVLRSGSIFTGMLFHFLNNALAVLAQTERLPGPINAYLENNTIEQNGFPPLLLLAALATLIAGIIIMELTQKPSPVNSDTRIKS